MLMRCFSKAGTGLGVSGGGGVVKRPLLVCLALCAALLLGGCAPLNFQNVNDLLRAPELGQGMGDIQKALVAELNTADIQYKYPKEGSQRGPILMADLNGDGKDEGVLVYSLGASAEKSSIVNLAVLEQNDEDEWQVTYQMQGLDTEVASFQAVDLLGTGAMQLLVGYGNSNLTTRTLCLYTYSQQSLTQELQQGYSRYELGDFSGSGGSDLLVVTPENDQGGLMLRYYPTAEGHFLEQPAAIALDTNFQSCSGIYAGISAAIEGENGPEERRMIVVDGLTSTGLLSSQILYFQPQGPYFYTIGDTNPLRGVSSRANSLLKSADIDEDGVVEIPKQVKEITTPRADKRLEFVNWLDCSVTAVNPEIEPTVKQFGLVDSDRSFYIHLPEAWRDKVEVVDGSGKGEWRMQRISSGETLLSLETVAAGSAQLGATLLPGTSDTYLVPSTALTPMERETLQAFALS